MIEPTGDGIWLDVVVLPNSRRPGLRGIGAGRLRIAVSAPAEGGRANDAMVEFVAGLLSVKTRQVEITAGRKSRQKRLLISGVSRRAATEAIRQQIGEED